MLFISKSTKSKGNGSVGGGCSITDPSRAGLIRWDRDGPEAESLAVKEVDEPDDEEPRVRFAGGNWRRNEPRTPTTAARSTGRDLSPVIPTARHVASFPLDQSRLSRSYRSAGITSCANNWRPDES